MQHTKIAIIGAGSVGSTTAYALMLRNVAAEIMLVDINEQRCTGEILDLADALPFCSASKVYKGTPQQAGQADIIIVSAGAAQKEGQTRPELFQVNKKIISSIFDDIKPIKKNSIVIMVTNPVDALTHHAQQVAGLPQQQVFGSGTWLDSQRLRGVLAQKLHVAEQSVNAFMLGEHGDTQFPAWSCASIGGKPITDFPDIKNDLENIARCVRSKAYEIIKCKGSTFYGIATCVSVLCEAIIFNQKKVLPLSTFVKDYGTCLSVPVVLGNSGIEKQLPLELNAQEQQLFEASAQAIKSLL